MFLHITVSFFGLIRNVFMFKSRDGIYTLKRFYEQEENSIDLLILRKQPYNS